MFGGTQAELGWDMSSCAFHWGEETVISWSLWKLIHSGYSAHRFISFLDGRKPFSKLPYLSGTFNWFKIKSFIEVSIFLFSIPVTNQVKCNFKFRLRYRHLFKMVSVESRRRRNIVDDVIPWWYAILQQFRKLFVWFLQLDYLSSLNFVV